MNLDFLRVFLGWTALVAWVGSLVLGAIDRTYEPEPTVHLLMMLVAGVLFGPSLARRRNGRGGEEDA